MTVFDYAVIAVVVLSALLAFARGVVRELVAVASWIAGIFAALAFSGELAPMIPAMESSPVARHVVAAALIFIAVLVVGAIVAWMLSKLVQAVGLGFVDRFLGGVFGIARGALIVVVAVLLAGLTSLPRNEWWQNALLAPPAVAAALSLRQWLPPTWAERLDYSGTGRKPARSASGAGLAPRSIGEPEACAESLA